VISMTSFEGLPEVVTAVLTRFPANGEAVFASNPQARCPRLESNVRHVQDCQPRKHLKRRTLLHYLAEHITRNEADGLPFPQKIDVDASEQRRCCLAWLSILLA